MWNPFLWGKQRKNKTLAKASLVADNRSPCHRAKRYGTIVRCSGSHTAHCHWSEKKIILLWLFAWLNFQALRTQRSSVNITLSVFKQTEQKAALRRWVFLGHTPSTIQPACTCVQKCPADPDRSHFVNRPHCHNQKGGLAEQVYFL